AARMGDAIDPRPRTRHAPTICGRPQEAGHSRPDAREQTRDHVGQARSLLHEGDRGSEKHSARAALPRRQADRTSGQARRAGDGRATPTRYVQPFRRLAGARLGLTRTALALVIAVLPSLAFAANAAADERKPPPKAGPSTVTLGHYSQQDDRTRASIGASIRVTRAEPGSDANGPSRTSSRVVRLPVKGGATDDLPDVDPYPPLASDSALARDPQPVGPGSFWYPVGPGRMCIYAPGSVLPCYTL